MYLFRYNQSFIAFILEKKKQKKKLVFKKLNNFHFLNTHEYSSYFLNFVMLVL